MSPTLPLDPRLPTAWPLSHRAPFLSSLVVFHCFLPVDRSGWCACLCFVHRSLWRNRHQGGRTLVSSFLIVGFIGTAPNFIPIHGSLYMIKLEPVDVVFNLRWQGGNKSLCAVKSSLTRFPNRIKQYQGFFEQNFWLA